MGQAQERGPWGLGVEFPFPGSPEPWPLGGCVWMWQVLSCHRPPPKTGDCGQPSERQGQLGGPQQPCPGSVLPLPRWYPCWASLLQEAPEHRGFYGVWSLESGNLRNVTRGVACHESSPVILGHPAWGKAASPRTKDPEAPGAVAARGTAPGLQLSVRQEQAGPEQGC